MGIALLSMAGAAASKLFRHQNAVTSRQRYLPDVLERGIARFCRHYPGFHSEFDPHCSFKIIASTRRGIGALLGLLIFGSLWALSIRFLENALSFEGWLAHSYAASLAAALTLLGFSVARPFLVSDGSEIRAGSARRAIPLVIIATLFAVIALSLPTLVGGGDWNGFYSGHVHIGFLERSELLHFPSVAQGLENIR